MTDALLRTLRETVESLMAAKQSSSPVPAETLHQARSKGSVVLMELKSQICEASTVDVAVSGAGAVEAAKRRVAEADDEPIDNLAKVSKT